MNVNKLFIAGNLTRDPELRHTQAGKTVANFGIALNRSYKTEFGEKRDEVTFLDVTAFGRTAEVISERLGKGSPIFIEGRLKPEQWDDKQTGQKRSKIAVICEAFQFVGKRDETSGVCQAAAEPTQPEAGGDASEDDVPF